MKKLVPISIALVFLVSLILVSSYTNAQREQQHRMPQQPGVTRINPAQMISRSMALEASWAQISFALDVSDEQLIEARKAYQEAWNDSRELAKKVASKELEFRDARTKVREIRNSLNSKMKEILTDQQYAKFKDWLKKSSRRQRPRGEGERRRPKPQKEGAPTR